MTWSTPPTFTSGNVLTAAQLNILSDDLKETAPAKATAAGQLFVSTASNTLAARTPTYAEVLTQESTTATSPTDLTTPGPSVTVTTGTTALVIYSTFMNNNPAGATQCAPEVSGATTIAADVHWALIGNNQTANTQMQDAQFWWPTLTAGSNTFKLKYWTSNNTGLYRDRRILVIPF